MEKRELYANKLTMALLLIYLIILAWIILLKFGVEFPYMEERKINLVPFANGYYDKLETIFNVIIFIPLGIYTSILFRKSAFQLHLFVFFLISLMLEGLQYAIKLGTFDVTDLLTNTSGGIMGYLLVLVLGRLNKNPLKTQKQLNLIAGIGTFIIVLLLVLLKLDMLPIRYQ
jgi:glycopeptide antibiotics resistance protein